MLEFRQTILMKYHSLFFSKIERGVAKFVVCCSHDWRFKACKKASENGVCLICLLHTFAYITDYFEYRGQQCIPRPYCSYLIWVRNVCLRGLLIVSADEIDNICFDWHLKCWMVICHQIPAIGLISSILLLYACRGLSNILCSET